MKRIRYIIKLSIFLCIGITIFKVILFPFISNPIGDIFISGATGIFGFIWRMRLEEEGFWLPLPFYLLFYGVTISMFFTKDYWEPTFIGEWAIDFITMIYDSFISESTNSPEPQLKY